MATLSLWDFIHTNPGAGQAGLERLYANYQLPFLVEIRDLLKFWIEENFINSNTYLDADNPDHYPTIYNLLHAFILKIDDEVKRLSSENPAHALIIKLVQASNLMKNELAFPQRVQILYKGIRRVLNVENGFVQQLHEAKFSNDTRRASADQVNGSTTKTQNAQNQGSQTFAQIGTVCLQLKMETDNSTQILKCIHQKQTEVAESFCLQTTLKEVMKKPVENGHTRTEEARKQLEEVQSNWKSKCDALNYFVHDFVEKNRRILSRSTTLLNDSIQKELANRKREIIAWTTNQIDIFQGYCSDLAEVLIRCRLQLIELQGLYPTMTELSTLQTQISELGRKLERISLIIETQPCQVIKKDTKFMAKVRFLAGFANRNVSSHISFGSVTASFLTKAEVRKLVRFDAESTTLECKAGNGACEPSTSTATGARRGSRTVPVRAKATPVRPSPSSSATLEIINESGRKIVLEIGGDIVNNAETLQTEDASFSATFQTSKIQNIFKRDREPGKSVLDLEYWILFHMMITETINGLSHQRWVWVVSNPIKVHTHADQRAHAFETIIWLNAMDPETLFSDEPRPRALPWPNMARALNSKCLEMTKVPLSAEQLEVLKEKAFSVPVKNGFVQSDHITFNQFCKTEFIEYKFTFWRWFYEIMKLVSKHMCGSEGKNGPWQDGHVAGFMSRGEAERRLMLGGFVGSFLLRFSDSELGGVSIVGLRPDGSTFSIEPANNEALLKRPLAERVLDIVYLTHLYPNKPKADVFTPYLQKKDVTAQSNALHKQYVKTFLQTVVTLPGEPKREQFATPSPRSSIVASLSQPTPPATPSYPFLMSNDSSVSKPSCSPGYSGYSPSSSNGFAHREDEHSDTDEALKQFKKVYPSETSLVCNDEWSKDLEKFLEQCVQDMDISVDSHSDEEFVPLPVANGEFETEYL